eukprot:TRINITY_DN3855_c0_g1_i1.p1 TRINITY_DN3855_c0_g1~~TRINITY_DN3855_c0_g1_i1.p1  ORF type:complete len:174 (-),score=10.29 TRINITY_DN3855_c0_g1_i1:23-544(-)
MQDVMACQQLCMPWSHVCAYSNWSSNPTDFLNRLVMAIITLKSGIDSTATVDMTPVDYAAKAIVHIFCRSFGGPKSTSVKKKKIDTSKLTFHITNPNCISYSQISLFLSKKYDIVNLSYETWRLKLLNDVADSPQHPLYPLAFQFVSPYPKNLLECRSKNTKIVYWLSSTNNN